LGLGGLLDVASEMNIEHHVADFGQTLGHYGVPPGPYLVIPFLGSSTLRDTLASTLISRGDLVWQLKSVASRNGLYALRLLDKRANILRSTSVLEAVALDKYTFTRDIYLQIRRNDILDGKEPPEEPSEVQEFKENQSLPLPLPLPLQEEKPQGVEKKSELPVASQISVALARDIDTSNIDSNADVAAPQTISLQANTGTLDAQPPVLDAVQVVPAVVVAGVALNESPRSALLSPFLRN
jgi:MlaA lipoprotein